MEVNQIYECSACILLTEFAEDAVNKARIATQVLFEKNIQDLTANDIVDALSDDPRLAICPGAEAIEQPIWRLAAKYGLVNSGGE